MDGNRVNQALIEVVPPVCAYASHASGNLLPQNDHPIIELPVGLF